MSEITPPLLQAGASYTERCGLRDWATTLAPYLSDASALDRGLWWERDDDGRFSAPGVRALRNWGARLRTLDGGSAVLWHYSVFTYGVRGVAIFAPSAAWWVRRSPAPVIVVLHEFAYPWRGRGWRGAAFAFTTRLALVPVLWACRAAIVTTEERARWVRSRWWLPRRTVTSVPVSSTVPEALTVAPGPGAGGPRVGVFVSPSSPARARTVVDAVALLRAEGMPVRLVLFGGAGLAGDTGESWRQAVRAAGCADAVEFTGTLTPAQLSSTLRSLDVVVAPNEEGPTSRKTTIASALAHGACVVAFTGPEQWDALVEEGAVMVIDAGAGALAGALRNLLGDEAERRAQGRRASEFYRRRMAPEQVAPQIRSFVTGVTGPN